MRRIYKNHQSEEIFQTKIIFLLNFFVIYVDILIIKSLYFE